MEGNVVYDVVAGCYEQVLLGYELRLSDNKKLEFKLRFTEHSHTGCIRCLAVSDTHLASGSTDETIQLYNLKMKREIGALMQHEGSVSSIGFYSNTHLLSGSEDGTLCLWKTGSWECLKTLKGHRDGLVSLSIHPSGKLAMSIGKDKTLKTWNLIIGRTAYITNIKKVGEIIQFSPSGNCYIVAADKQVDVYDLESAKVVHSFDTGIRIFALVFITEDIVAVAGDSESIKLFSIQKESCLSEFEAHSKRVKSLKTVSDPRSTATNSKLLVSASSDGYIKVWAVNTDKARNDPVLLTEVNTSARLTCVAIAPRKHKKKEPQVAKKESVNTDNKERQVESSEKSDKSSKEKQKADKRDKKRSKKRKAEDTEDKITQEDHQIKKKKKHKDKQKDKKKLKTKHKE
ncbi:p21-activated protein kinase-interacting protein 1-like [Glandiceps talaboti]